MRRKRNGLVSLSYSLSFLLAFLLVLLAMVGVLGITVCNPAFLKTRVLQSGFCTQVQEELQENYQSYGTASGFSPELMRGLVVYDQIQTDMFSSVDSFFAGSREDVVHVGVHDAMLQALTQEVQTRGVSLTSEVQEGLEQLAAACQRDYSVYVRIPFVKYIAPLMAKLKTMVWVSLLVLLFCAGLTSLLLCLLQRSAQTRLRYHCYAFAAPTLFCVLVPFAGMLLQMERINISPLSIKLLIGSYATGVMQAFWYVALIFAVLTAAVGVSLYLKMTRMRRYAAYRQQEETGRGHQPQAANRVVR